MPVGTVMVSGWRLLPIAAFMAVFFLLASITVAHADVPVERIFTSAERRAACALAPRWNTGLVLQLRPAGWGPPPKTGVGRSLLETELMPRYAISSKDTADWVAIQSALLFAAHRSPRGSTVRLKRGRYRLSRNIWLKSNTKLVFDPGAELLMVTQSKAGSIVSNVNPYNRRVAAYHDDLVCNIIIENPVIDAGAQNGVLGENGIGFANGAQNILVVGGEIRNARRGGQDIETGRSRQGGRGLQFEQGVADVMVIGTKVSSSTIGFSSGSGATTLETWRRRKKAGKPRPSSGDFTALRRNDRIADGVYDKAWNIVFREIVAEDVELPFIIYNHIANADRKAFATHDTQRIVIDGAQVDRSGRLEYPTGQRLRKAGVQREDVARASTIVMALGASRLQIHGLRVRNPLRGKEYGPVGSLMHLYGRDISVSNVEATGNYDTLFDLSGEVWHLAANGPTVSNVALSDIRVQGSARKLMEMDPKSRGISLSISRLHLGGLRLDRNPSGLDVGAFDGVCDLSSAERSNVWLSMYAAPMDWQRRAIRGGLDNLIDC